MFIESVMERQAAKAVSRFLRIILREPLAFPGLLSADIVRHCPDVRESSSSDSLCGDSVESARVLDLGKGPTNICKQRNFFSLERKIPVRLRKSSVSSTNFAILLIDPVFDTWFSLSLDSDINSCVWYGKNADEPTFNFWRGII